MHQQFEKRVSLGQHMKKTYFLFITALCFNALAMDKVIYGYDNRVEGIDSAMRLELKSVAAMVAEEELKLMNGGYRVRHYSTLNNVRGKRTCSDMRFRSQPTISTCTGFLIAPDKLLTAGHCLLKEGQRAKNKITNACMFNKWVFDYNNNLVGEDEIKFKSSQVASCERIIDGAFNDDYDYAIVKLDKKIRQKSFDLTYALSDYDLESSLKVLGHPSGLPSKVAFSGRIKKKTPSFITTDLDTFAGNSGSPVLNSYGEVIAILVSGETDFYWDERRKCYTENRCDSFNGECSISQFDRAQGEKAFKLSKIKTKILKALRD